MKLIVPGLVVVGLVVAWTAAQQLGEPAADEALARGRAHVEATCAGCHPGSQLETVVARRIGDREALDRFLTSHHVPDAALRADVIAYLQTHLATTPAGS